MDETVDCSHQNIISHFRSPDMSCWHFCFLTQVARGSESTPLSAIRHLFSKYQRRRRHTVHRTTPINYNIDLARYDVRG